MRKSLDEALTMAYETYISRGLLAANFLKKNKDAFGLFVGAQAADHLVQVVATNKDPDTDVFEAAALESSLVRVVFSKHVREMTYKQLIKDVDTGVKELVYANFELSEVQAFRKIMRETISRLEKALVFRWGTTQEEPRRQWPSGSLFWTC